ncbi:transcriptional regulator, TetR family [Duganella sp. CF402]|uniref:TetR/AcrR family transcriptional regulator n=1 Tax=unclassified Duganella TaxID=2636909 RepID=UPI0008CD8B90|nr:MULTISPECIES: TetR/AcrR family transcriptional regulator [unclassified Duganella]RZT08186.1 TetR family transcriptional regulator [Duganella sp. BK701]SEM02787.1 transcriptional regulator, TetR family [Duganella sp. CF402]
MAATKAKKAAPVKAEADAANDDSARRTQSDRRAESTQKILDCAEANFAKLGFYGVTLNDIAQQCGMPTALIRYYYDDKQALLNEVFRRRASVINEERVRALEEYKLAAKGKMTIEGLLDAYLNPVFNTMVAEEGWRMFGALVAQVGILPAWGGPEEFNRDTFDPVIKIFLQLLRELAVGVSDEDLFWYYHLVSGSLLVSLSQTGQIDRISKGLCASTDLQSAGKHISMVFAAGFHALPRAKKPRKKTTPTSN